MSNLIPSPAIGLPAQRPANRSNEPATGRNPFPDLLVTTCTPPREGVYLVNTATGATERLHHRPTRGITRGADGIYFVEHRGDIFHLDLESRKVTRRLETGQTGCHDLRWINGEYYLVASYGNRITRYDAAFRRIDELQLVPDEGDVCHPNCLVERNGELLLSVFTLSRGRREDKRGSDMWRQGGKILQLDWHRKRYEIVFEPLAQPHSLVPCGNEVLCCESHNSEIVSVDLHTGVKRPIRKLHGFVRGMVLRPEGAYVGISQEKRKRPLPWYQRWASRRQMPCGVLLLDRNTWKVLRQFPVPGTEVYDFLALD